MTSRVNPYSGEALVSYPPSDVPTQIEALRARQHAWRRTPLQERVQVVSEALEYFEVNRETLARCISEEMGRPLKHARGEIDGLLERGRHLARIAPKVLAPERLESPTGFQRAIVHEPLGIVLVVSAWNYPLLITINGVMAALLGGNTVLLKHATQTLSLGEHFATAFGDLVAHAVTSHEEIGRVLRQGEVDHAIFTGSTESGRVVYQAAAAGLLDCQLELGGKDAAYVAADADLDWAADALVDGAMYNAGQSCCGIERLFVHGDCHDAFVEKCRQRVAAYVLGDPEDERTDMGPLAIAANAEVMERQVADAVAAGATLLHGGHRRLIGEGTFFEPTLLTRVNPAMSVMREENFGPILPIMEVADDEEAMIRVNDSAYGLTSVIFTADLKRAEWFASEADTGTVFMNRCDYLDPALPWTGAKNSGIGSALSHYGLLGVTRRKAKHFRVTQG